MRALGVHACVDVCALACCCSHRACMQEVREVGVQREGGRARRACTHACADACVHAWDEARGLMMPAQAPRPVVGWWEGVHTWPRAGQPRAGQPRSGRRAGQRAEHTYGWGALCVSAARARQVVAALLSLVACAGVHAAVRGARKLRLEEVEQQCVRRRGCPPLPHLLLGVEVCAGVVKRLMENGEGGVPACTLHQYVTITR